MSALSERFVHLRDRGEKALVLFVTAGDPSIEELPAIVSALEEGGADAVEIGIPFSDPFGEGPTIQASSQRALERGITPRMILDQIALCETDIPLLTMGYYNPILRYGLRRFACDSAASGVSGTIVSDLVPDESGEWCQASREAGLETVFLVAPTSTEQRIGDVASKSTGFVYAVSRTGVTGAESEVPIEVQGLVNRIKARTTTPVCVGFGVSTPHHVEMVCQVADGAVVGSALVRRLHESWKEGIGKDALVDWVRALKSATVA